MAIEFTKPWLPSLPNHGYRIDYSGMAFETVFKWPSVFCLEIIGNQNGKQNWRPDTETIGNRNWQPEWQPSLGLNQNGWHSNSDPTENRFCGHFQWRIFQAFGRV